MRDGISGAPLPGGFPYKAIIETVCFDNRFFPCLVGAVKMNETGLGQGPATENDISFDNGHGVFQLTSSWPDPGWNDPLINCTYAVAHFLVPAYNEWRGELQGDDLVRAIAATYNAGLGNAQAGHAHGDIDEYTTNHYAARCLANYQALKEGTIP